MWEEGACFYQITHIVARMPPKKSMTSSEESVGLVGRKGKEIAIKWRDKKAF